MLVESANVRRLEERQGTDGRAGTEEAEPAASRIQHLEHSI